MSQNTTEYSDDTYTAPCRSCTEPISTDADICPRCKHRGPKGPWIGFAAGVLLSLLGFVVGPGMLLAGVPLLLYGGYKLTRPTYGPIRVVDLRNAK